MAAFVYLQQAAEAIAKNEIDSKVNCRHWDVTCLTDELHKAFRTAVFNSELPAYNTKTKLRYIPGQHENTIFTTPEAINKWLDSQGVQYRYTPEGIDEELATKVNHDFPLREYEHEIASVPVGDICQMKIQKTDQQAKGDACAQSKPGSMQHSSNDIELSRLLTTPSKKDEHAEVGADIKERELTKWMRETWIIEGSPGGTDFFNALKKYVKIHESPITEHYTTSKHGAGIKWNTGKATSTMTKKTIQTKVSKFKNAL